MSNIFLLRERMFRSNIVSFIVRVLTSLSLLFSTAAPVAAAIQYPAGSDANSPYDYVSSGTVNNPADSGTEITAAALTENPYSTDTAQYGTDVNNGVFNLTYKPALNDDLYIYSLTKTTTNLKNNSSTSETFDYGAKIESSGVSAYRLLNVYPTEEGNIGSRIMNETRSDGGRYYNDPITEEQLFTFDSVYWDTFMANPGAYMKNTDGSYKYDGIFFGAADCNANKDFSSAAVTATRAYIQAGYAVVEGHDIPGCSKSHPGGSRQDVEVFHPIFNYRQVLALIEENAHGTTAYVSNCSGTGAAGSESYGNPLTSYPYKYNIGTGVPIGLSHIQWFPSIENTNVWLTYSNSSRTFEQYYADAYLFTSKQYPNVAVSHAGHSNIYENDLKLIINMLLYILPKRNGANSVSVEAKDIAAPAQPVIRGQKRTGKTNLMFNVAADDFGTQFDFTLQPTGVYSSCGSSNKAPITFNNAAIKSGTTWYLYSADTDENGTISYTVNCLGLPVASGETTMIEGGAADTLSVTIPASARYLHIAAVDQAGNVSEVTTVEIPRTEDLTVKKAFVDFDNRYNLRPAEIIFDAFAGSDTTSSGDCTASDDNGYSCTISDLLAYDANGDEITYTVKERNTPNAYTASEPTIVIAQNKSITVTNTLVTQEISVMKIWSDGNNQDGIRPGSISFTLFCGTMECGDNPYTITGDDNWMITIPDIPVYDANGQAYEHSVVEDSF